MSKLSDKPGRRIELRVIYNYDRQLVQIIRNLKDTHGFLVDSGNIGFMPLEDWKVFLEKESTRASSGKDRPLYEQFAAGPQQP